MFVELKEYYAELAQEAEEARVAAQEAAWQEYFDALEEYDHSVDVWGYSWSEEEDV